MGVLRGKLQNLAYRFFNRGVVKFGEFRLKAHETNPELPLSPIYVNLRTDKHPKNPGPLTEEDMRAIGEHYDDVIQPDAFDCFADIPDAGEPFGDQFEAALARLGLEKRRLRLHKAFGEDGKRYITDEVDGAYRPGDVVWLLDDLITGADTKLEAIRALEAKGLVVKVIVVVVDRQQGGVQQLERAGYRVIALLKLDELLDTFVEWAQDKVEEVREYIAANQLH